MITSFPWLRSALKLRCAFGLFSARDLLGALLHFSNCEFVEELDAQAAMSDQEALTWITRKLKRSISNTCLNCGIDDVVFFAT